MTVPRSELNARYPGDDGRNAILAASLKLFAANGFHGAKVRDIAREANVSQPLLHHHFKEKGALWRLVGEWVTAEFMTFMADAVDPMLPAGDGLRTMLAAYMDYWRKHPLSFRFNLWRLLDGPRSEREARSEHITRHGVALVQRAQQAGFIRNDLPPGLALVMSGSIIQFWLHSQLEVRDALAVTGDEALSDEAFLDLLISLFAQ